MNQPNCTCPSGNGSLRWPCPAHPPSLADALRHAVAELERSNAVMLREAGMGVTDQRVIDAGRAALAAAEAQPAQADLSSLARAAGMVCLLDQGAASCVHSEGCNGVTQEHLQRFADLVRSGANPTKAERVHAIVNAGHFPGMSEAFDAYMGAACWTDPAYAPDASMWASAWKAAKARADHIPDAGNMVQPVAVPQEPIGVEAVAEVVMSFDGPVLRWLIEGGIHDLQEGVVLVVPHQPITDANGSGEVHLAATAAPAPALVPQGWISVEDRLPEPDSGEVLVWLDGGMYALEEWHAYREDPLGMSTVHTLDMGYRWRNFESDEITHWMPLPAAPSIGGEA